VDQVLSIQQEKEMMANIEFLLVTQGWAQLRTGERRSDTKARTILQKAAKKVDIPIKTTKGEGFIRADEK